MRKSLRFIGKCFMALFGVGMMGPVAQKHSFILSLLWVTFVIYALMTPVKLRAGMQTMGGVSISLSNGGLGGTLQTNDGVVGFVTTMVSEAGGYTIGTPLLLTGMASVATAGITQANNPYAFRHITEFYNQALDGAELYFMGVADTQTIAMICSESNASGAIKLLNYGAGNIKVIGCITDDVAVNGVTAITITNGINADCYTAAANLKVMLTQFTANQQPCRGLIGGTSYNGTASALTNETAGTTNNRVGMIIGDTQVWDATHTSAAMGLCLGTIASLPVQRKISRVKNGPLTNLTCYLGTVALINGNPDVTTISGKGYITFTTYVNKAGFFWQGDPMLTATTDDYCSLSNGRVVDKMQVITYSVYIEEVDDEIPLNTDGSGTMLATYAAYLQQEVIDAINTEMVVTNEISGFNCFVDPTQDVVTQGGTNIVETATPVGYNGQINVLLGFQQ